MNQLLSLEIDKSILSCPVYYLLLATESTLYLLIWRRVVI